MIGGSPDPNPAAEVTGKPSRGYSNKVKYGKGKLTEKTRQQHQLEQYVQFQQYLKNDLKQQMAERNATQAGALQAKRENTSTVIAAPVQPGTAEEVASIPQPAKVIDPDFMPKGAPFQSWEAEGPEPRRNSF